MQFLSSIVTFSAIIVASSALEIEPTDFSEDPVESRALYNAAGQNYGQNRIVMTVKCAVDTLDGISEEFKVQAPWQDVQQKVRANMNALISCLKFQGFQSTGCIAKEIITVGLAMNDFIGKLDSNTPEAGRQLRLRMPRNCGGNNKIRNYS